MPSALILLAAALGLPLAIAGGIVLLEQLTKRPEWGAGMVMALVVIVAGLGNVIPPIDTGSVVIIYSDITSVLLIGAATMRLLRRGHHSTPSRLAVPFMLLVVYAIYRGAGVGVINEAFRESRNFLAYGGAILYFSTFRLTAEQREAIGRVWLFGAIGLITITFIRWGGLVVGVPQTGIWARPQEPGSIRVIDGRNALVILQALLIIAPVWIDRRAKSWEKTTAVLCLLVVLLMQHRTVWITLLVAGLVAAARDPRLGRPLVAGFAILVLVGSFSLVQLDNSSLDETVAEDGTSAFVPRSPADSGSFEWRAQGWFYLMTHNQPPPAHELLYGRPFGEGYTRQLSNGNFVDTVPHNFYIETYLRVGVLGVGLLFLLIFGTLFRLSRRGRYDRDGRLLTSETLYVLMLTHVVHSMAWSPDLEQGVLVGIAASVAFASRQPGLRAARGSIPPGPRAAVAPRPRQNVGQRS